MKKAFLSVFLLFLVFSCKDSKKKKLFQNFEKSVSIDKEYYPIQDLNLINKSEQIIIYYPEAISAVGYYGIVINIVFNSNEEFNQEINRISKCFEIKKINILENMNFYKANGEVTFNNAYSKFFRAREDIIFYSSHVKNSKLINKELVISGVFVDKEDNKIMYILFVEKIN